MGSAVVGIMATSVAPTTPVGPTFANGGFTGSDFSFNQSQGLWITNGWAIGNAAQVWLNGVSTIQGFPTPTDPTPTPYSSPGEAIGNPMNYNFELVTTDLPPGITYPPDRVCRLYSSGTVAVPYGLVNGPYLASTSAVSLSNGSITSFWWKAANGGDAYNVIAYLLNIATGATIVLLRATGPTDTSFTTWAQVTRTFSTAGGDVPGNYKFVFVSGSYDASGGTGIGASLYVTDIAVN